MSEQALVDQILDIAFAGSDADVRARKGALWTVATWFTCRIVAEGP